MKLLKIGFSGVRGIVGETVTPELVMDFAAAFGTHLGGGRVLVGRDTRPSSPMLRAAVSAALVSTGCDVVDLGVCPTPILQFRVPKLRARGAVSITAGHNGADWNALAFIGRDGTFLDEFQGQSLLDIYHLERFAKASFRGLGRTATAADGGEGYFRELGRCLDRKAIAAAGLKVVIDACNGAAAAYLALFARTLGLELIPVNDAPTGLFPHDPEPRPRNAGEVASIVKLAGADAGFLLSSDAGRISVVAEDGETLSEEYAFPLVADHSLRKAPGVVITNLSTSRMIDDVAANLGLRVVKTRVGQAHLVQALLAEDGALAGEGSGGVAVRGFQPAFDAFAAMGLILESMAASCRPVSALVRALPKYHIVKESLPCPPSKVHTIVASVRDLFEDREVVAMDGVRAESPDGWVHVRASATEPLLRVIAENRSKERAREELDRVIRHIAQRI